MGKKGKVGLRREGKTEGGRGWEGRGRDGGKRKLGRRWGRKKVVVLQWYNSQSDWPYSQSPE